MLNAPIDLEVHAYVDGQLDEPARLLMLSRLANNPSLRQQVADVQMLKALVASSYALNVSDRPISLPKQRLEPMVRYMVASFALVVALSVGWLAHSLLQPAGVGVVLPLNMAKGNGNYVVQLSKGNEADWQEGVAEIERLLLQSMTSQVELLVNDEAILMLDKHSPVANKLLRLTQDSERLTLSACKQGLERWRARGLSVNLISGVDTSHSALEGVINRLKEGWYLVPVDKRTSA